MGAIDLGDLKNHIDDMIERLSAGEVVNLVKDGRLVATVTPAVTRSERASQPIDFEALFAFTASLPFDPTNAGDLVRQMRDEARY